MKNKYLLVIINAVIIISIIVGYTYSNLEYQAEINNLKIANDNEKSLLETQIQNLETQLGGIESELNDTKGQLTEVQEELEEKYQEIIDIYNGTRYNLHNPTFSEARYFINNDLTNQIPYEPVNFTCAHYAQGVNNNAEDMGIACAVVVLNFNQSSHAIIAFNSTDRGMVYFEPQTDDIVVNLEIGNDYWTDCVINDPGWYYIDDSDDTIESIMTYW
ncbi:MAG: hypothetical protein KAW45_03850 [Thermoplasmatales archaeon]|nr:hypothetical protein [Thermoplasmatales archaeon]